MKIDLNKLERLAREAVGKNKKILTDAYVEYLDEVTPQVVLKLLEDYKIMREALVKVDIMLTIPAAEYVPAIGDCFTVIDEALEQIRNEKGEI